MSNIAPIVIPAVKKHTAAVIVLHGLGDTGNGWMSLASDLRRQKRLEHVSFIFPTAPTVPITANFHMQMPAWYDITSFTDLHQRSTDTARILSSRSYVHSLITDLSTNQNIPPERIVVGGFSQGGALALLAGLTGEKRLGGVFALSGYLIYGAGEEGEKRWGELAAPRDRSQEKVFMGHGKEDPLVRCEWGRASAEALRKWGWGGVEFTEYPGLEHSVAPEEIAQLESWLEDRLPETTA